MTKISIFALAVSLLSASTYAFAPTSLQTVVATTTANTALGMFTGIVEEMGTVVNMQDRNDMTLWDGSIGRGTELTVRGNVVMDGAYLGYVQYGCDEHNTNLLLSIVVNVSVWMHNVSNNKISVPLTFSMPLLMLPKLENVLIVIAAMVVDGYIPR